MDPLMDRIVESKRAMRTKLAALPFSEKVAILEKLRDRSLMIAKSSLGRQYLTEPGLARKIAASEAARKSSAGTGSKS